jgi:hypothetical protein
MDQQTQHAFGQMQQQLQQQQQQLQQQAQQQQQLLAQLAAVVQPAVAPAAAAGGVAGGRSVVKPKPPSTFTAAGKVGELDQWEREMRYQFAAYGAPLSSDAARLAFAVSYLGAVPLQWWDADATHRDVSTWDEFVALLRARFRPVHAARQARTELFRIKQTASQDAGAYAAAFQELLTSLPDMHVDDQVFLFVRGLLAPLKRRVGDKEFSTLSAAINAAVQSEGLYGVQLADDPQLPSARSHEAGADAGRMDLNAIKSEEWGPRAARRVSAFQAGSLSAQVADLQEQLFALGVARGSARQADRVGGLSKKQIEERLQSGQCLRCGSKGHYKRDCPDGQ